MVIRRRDLLLSFFSLFLAFPPASLNRRVNFAWQLTVLGFFSVIHIAQAIKYRMWFLFITIILCGAIELLGWSGRLWSTYNLLSQTAFTLE